MSQISSLRSIKSLHDNHSQGQHNLFDNERFWFLQPNTTVFTVDLISLSFLTLTSSHTVTFSILVLLLMVVESLNK